MNKRTRFSPEVRERAVRMVFEHRSEYGSQWKAIESMAEQSPASRRAARLLRATTNGTRPRNEAYKVLIINVLMQCLSDYYMDAPCFHDKGCLSYVGTVTRYIPHP